MSLKVDHQTISEEEKRAHLLSTRPFFTAIDAYPDDHPYVSAVTKQIIALGSLVGHLSDLYNGEVSEVEHGVLGRRYECDLREDQWENAVGAAQFQDKPDSDRHGFSKTDITNASRSIIEIGESLAYVTGLISRYDPQHGVNVAIKTARACNTALGSHVGLSSKRVTRIA